MQSRSRSHRFTRCISSTLATPLRVQVAFDNAKVKVLDEATESADCTLTLSEKNFRKLLADDLNATMAFMTGSLKIDGKLGLALKLQEVLKQTVLTMAIKTSPISCGFLRKLGFYRCRIIIHGINH
ncbi:SCP2 sterol-binding domain-containing protein [Paenibacillus sp. JTLBN-2024]